MADFLGSITYEQALEDAVKRLELQGRIFPQNHLSALLERFPSADSIPHPYTLIRIGRPRIKEDFYHEWLMSNPGKLLDYGCGTGNDLRYLLENGFNCVGIDTNEALIQYGLALFNDEADMKARFVLVKDFIFSEETFDYVYSGDILSFIRPNERENYLNNTYRVLKKGGYFVGRTLGSDDFSAPYIDSLAHYLFSADELEQMLINAGFSINGFHKKKAAYPNNPRLRFSFVCEKVKPSNL